MCFLTSDKPVQKVLPRMFHVMVPNKLGRRVEKFDCYKLESGTQVSTSIASEQKIPRNMPTVFESCNNCADQVTLAVKIRSTLQVWSKEQKVVLM